MSAAATDKRLITKQRKRMSELKGGTVVFYKSSFENRAQFFFYRDKRVESETVPVKPTWLYGIRFVLC